MVHRWKQVAIASGLAASLAACADLDGDAEAPHSDRGGIGLSETTQALGSGVSIDPRRSLAVTDTAILGSFTLTAVMNQLVAQNGTTGFTATQLFRQLWDTQNGAPGQADLPGGAHCTDNGGTLNGFAYPCRPTEGQQAPLGALVTMTSYNAIGLFNRFDLAPTGGADCGEYRIVFAKNNASPGRNFIIFEAVLPNPRPDLGLEGCRPVTNFWRDLTTTTAASVRSSALQSFYFKGLPGFSPVIHMSNYGNNSTGAGQVRTNMFMQPLWLLREFKLKRDCPGTGCTLRFTPVTVKTNPFGNLFNPASGHPLAAQFQNTVFPSQVAALAVNDINKFSYSVPDQFNVGQSDSQTGGAVVDNYVAQFGTGPSTFRNNIQAQLTAIGSALTPDDIVARAQTQSCGGCHQRSNNAPLGGGLAPWPSSALFVHNSESTEVGPDGTRFQLSPALTTTFLPHREAVLESFLNQPRKLAGNLFKLTAVAAVKDTAYFLENTNPGTVWKVPAGGSAIALAGSRLDLTGVAADAASVYWIENHSPGGDVLKVPAAGGAITTLSGGRIGLVSVATDGVDVYWLEQNSTGGAIFKVPAAGGATTAVLTGRVGVRFIAVDAVNIYWIEGTTLLKLPKAGGAIAILAGGITASSLATDGVNLYWTENLSPGNIKQMPVAGGPQTVLHSGPLGLVGAAVDATSVYWLENTNPGVVMAGPK